VLILISKAKTTSEIAKLLFLSAATVSTYRARILEKMNMKNNSELMQYCYNQKLIE
jgi:DNA-binding CsgD family transcriptional regulator